MVTMHFFDKKGFFIRIIPNEKACLIA